MRPQFPFKIYGVRGIASASLLLLSGCMSLFHPAAEEWYQQAKGATARQTTLALITIMETTAHQAKAKATAETNVQNGESSALKDLHHQFHALHTTWEDFPDQQTAAAAYEHALTLHQELQTIFHRLWKLQGHTPLRNIHLNLFLSRLQELRIAVESIPA